MSEDFSLEDICAALYVSKGHLYREFKKSTDDTVMGYVETQRMEKAEALLRRSDYLVPLRDELHHIELFMQLYAYRYEGRLQIHTDVPADMMDARVLKLSVQPIVDNAIKHGLRSRRYRGNIWIGARREDGCILVTVENDGERMNENELARVNAQLAHPEASNLDEHIGLNNIARRIRLLFGAGYGVLLSNTETGMTVVMRLPESIPGAAGESDKKDS